MSVFFPLFEAPCTPGSLVLEYLDSPVSESVSPWKGWASPALPHQILCGSGDLNLFF